MVYSPRGGTGTSALAINLAAALDRIQHGVTLIDTDLQFGDLPVHLNMRPTKSLADLTTSNRPDAEALPDLLLTHSSGINLLFAPPKPETAELITGSMLVQVGAAAARSIVGDRHRFAQLSDRSQPGVVRHRQPGAAGDHARSALDQERPHLL